MQIYAFRYLFKKMDIEEQYELDILEEVGEEWDEPEIRSLISHVKANQFLVNKTETDFKNREKKMMLGK